MKHVYMGLGCVILATIASCSTKDKWEKARPPVYPASGQVLFNGKPLAGAKVNFHPVDGNYSAYGMTDEEGRFTLTTFDPDDGAVAGDYDVTIAKRDVYIVHDERNPELYPPIVYEPYTLIPEKYASAEESGLIATISETDENPFLFELTGEVPPLPKGVPESVLKEGP